MTVIINGTTGIDTVQDGIITNAKIASMAATKLTGQVPDANAPSGGVIQVVSAVYGTRQSFSTSGGGVYYDTGLTASITPSSASNKILIIVSAMHQTSYTGNGNCGSALSLKRNSTRITDPIGDHMPVTNIENSAPTGSINYLDSPATTSPTTYTVAVSTIGNSQTVYFNGTYSQTGFGATITLMEIAA